LAPIAGKLVQFDHDYWTVQVNRPNRSLEDFPLKTLDVDFDEAGLEF
jgi:hypothetical protein